MTEPHGVIIVTLAIKAVAYLITLFFTIKYNRLEWTAAVTLLVVGNVLRYLVPGIQFIISTVSAFILAYLIIQVCRRKQGI